MNEEGAARYFEPTEGTPFHPRDMATRCIESGASALLLDGHGVPPDFFDLSTRVAGELVHRLSLYRIRLAVVVADPSLHSPAFQDFVREANRGRQFRFFPTRAEAIEWLASDAVQDSAS